MSGENHRIRKVNEDDYIISWDSERYPYKGSRLVYRMHFERWTDKKGAERFMKKWGISLSHKEKGKG